MPTGQFAATDVDNGGITIPTDTIAYRNNNPGNTRFVGQPGASPGEGGFAKFDTPDAGYQDIHRLINLHTKQGHTLGQYINTYAPPSENDTAGYTAGVAKQLGVTPDTPLEKIDPERLAQAQAQRESGTKVEKAATVAPPKQLGQFGAGDVSQFGAGDVDIPQEPRGAVWDFLGGAPRSLGLPDTAAGWTEPPKNDVQGVWDALKEGNYGHAMAALGHMTGLGLTPAGGFISQAAEHLPKAYNAMQSYQDHISRGEFTEAAKALGDAHAHTAAAMIPGVGEYVNAADKIGAGDVAGGAGDLTFDTIRNLLGLKLGGGFKDIAADRAGAGVAAKWTEAQKKFGPDWPDPISKGLAEGYGSRQPGFVTSVRNALPTLRTALPKNEPLDFAHLPEAIRIAEEDNKAQAQRYEDNAIARGQEFDTSAIARAKRATIPAYIKKLDPNTYDALMDDANSYDGKKLTLPELRSLRATNNARLNAHYDKGEFGQYNDVMAHVKNASLRAETEAARGILEDGVDPERGGARYKELNARLKSILDLKEAHQALMQDLQAQAPNAKKPGGQFSVFDLTSPGNLLKATGKAALNRYQTSRADVNPYDSVARINAALKSYESYGDPVAKQYDLPRRTIARVPEPTAPPGASTTGRQLGPAQPLPPPDTSGTTVTTGEPFSYPGPRQLGAGDTTGRNLPARASDITPGPRVTQLPSGELNLKFNKRTGRYEYSDPLTGGPAEAHPAEVVTGHPLDVIETGRPFIPAKDAKETPIQQLLFPPGPREAPTFPKGPMSNRQAEPNPKPKKNWWEE